MRYYAILSPTGRFVGFKALSVGQMRKLSRRGWFVTPVN